MSCVLPIFKREMRGYFSTPIAYVFIVIFLFLTGLFTFKISDFFNGGTGQAGGGQATLLPFFDWHPWLYLFLIPAVAMRLWSEERRSGTIELLLTMPTTLFDAILAKFFAAWIFVGIALALTFPIVLTVMYLGHPDMGSIVVGYLGSFLMAGAFLAIGVCMSALTKNQVVSFILSVVICLMMILAGQDSVLDAFNSWAPGLADAVSSVSFLKHFSLIERGVITFPDLLFFASLIVGWLYATAVILEMKKGK